MQKAIFGLLLLAAAVNAGLIETQHVVHEPVVTKIGEIVHNSPSAVSHQSFTRVHHKAVVEPVLAPAVKTTLHAAPAVSVVHAAPAVVHAAPTIVHQHAPLVHTAPVVKTVLPHAYTLHH